LYRAPLHVAASRFHSTLKVLLFVVVNCTYA